MLTPICLCQAGSAYQDFIELGIDNYIESGHVELGLIEDLKPAEMEEFERLRAERPEVRKDALQTELLMEDLAQAYRVSPLPWLKSRVLGGLDKLFFF